METEPDRLLRGADVSKLVALSRNTIDRRVAAGTFPAPLDLGGGSVRWRQSDVLAWLSSLTYARQRAA